ncbi:MAG: glycosyltransferase [Verrucomicrobiae bacterium]|nr:glycosyltransferase [Verrucomicrobiae bacterium]
MLNFFVPLNSLGYGVHSYNLLQAYERYVSDDFAVYPIPQWELINEQTKRWVERGNRFRRSDPGITINQAPQLNRFCGQPMIGFPVFELDILSEYDQAMIAGMDAILQTSRWGKKVLENHGIRRVHIVPEGYDPEVYHPELSLEEKRKRIDRQGVTFVHVGKFEPRKSSQELLFAFIKATEDAKCRANLLFHVFNPFDPAWFERAKCILDNYQFRREGNRFMKGNATVLIPEVRLDGKMDKFYSLGEFGLWASKAEGWNLPLIECLACGLPCLTTDNTAQSEFIRKEIYPRELVISSRQTEPAKEGGEWWRLDLDEVVGKIRQVLDDPDRHLKMQDACQESIRPFTWENAARKLDAALKEICG